MRSSNPFVREQKIPMVLKKNSVKQTDTVDLINKSIDIDVNQQFLIDTQKKVNVFIDKEYLEAEMKLSNSALKMLIYIEYTLRWNQDYIQLIGRKSSNFKELTGISSPTTISKASIELCEAGFISKASKRGYYWINPFRFFNGSRKEKYSEHIEITNLK